MQNYFKDKDKIVVTNLSDFNITHILECGQIFRYKNIGDHYEVFSLNKKAKIFCYKNKVEIETKDVDYFVNFFDLDNDYSFIKSKLEKFEVLKSAIKFGYGIRILNQNAFEMIISFIISANNNIKRIQSIIENICKKFGTKLDEEDFYAFPTREQLLKASIADFRQAGAGYRAEYLYNVVRQLENFDYDFIKNNQVDNCLPVLLNLSGVGPKVADCILLFAFHKNDVFPVDTWITKIYYEFFKDYFENLDLKKVDLNEDDNSKRTNVKLIRKNLVNYFQNLSGYAQQYLFYYKRSAKDD